MRKSQREKIAEGLREFYTIEEAKEEIDQILAPYGEEVRISFLPAAAEIVNSWKVRSSQDRHRVCMIISRTETTNRDFENLCAEWRFHNDAWDLHIQRTSAKDVTLDYTSDPRRSVRFATVVYDKVNHE